MTEWAWNKCSLQPNEYWLDQSSKNFVHVFEEEKLHKSQNIIEKRTSNEIMHDLIKLHAVCYAHLVFIFFIT